MPTLELLLADDLEANLDSATERVVAEVRASVPDVFATPAREEVGRAGSASLLADFASVLRRGLQEGFHAPADAIAFGRQLAADGVSLAHLLRSYRVGQQASFARAVELLPAADEPDPGAAVARIGILSFAYADAAMSDVTAAYEHERERSIRQQAARRAEVLRALLAGDRVDPAEAERVLGRRLDGRHVALLAWRGDGEGLADDVRAALLSAGAGRPLVVPEPSGRVAAWFTPPRGHAWEERLAAALRGAGAAGALGSPLPGLDGFARTHQQAGLARTAGGGARTLTRYADVALDALLLRDREAARRFATEELGVLATLPSSRERDTLAAYYANAHDGSRTARALGVHRNTVARRLARAQAALGGDLDARAAERAAALRIVAAEV